LTFFGTVAAALCVLVTITDVFHNADPPVKVELSEVKRLTVHRNSQDQALLALKLDADLRSVFSWNTKQLFVYVQAEYTTPENSVNQVVLWDKIIQKKENAHLKIKSIRQKYALIDQGQYLRGRPLNITVVWNVMPKVGRLYVQSKSFAVGSLPDDYKY